MSILGDFPSKPDTGPNQMPYYGQTPYFGQATYWGQGPYWGQSPYWGSTDPFWTVPPKKKKHKSFLRKLGDAFCKALPTILITVTSAVIGAVFAQVPNVKVQKLA